VKVRLLALPVALHMRAQQRQDGLVRELTLMTLEGREDDHEVPSQVLRMSRELRERYGPAADPQQQLIEDAARRGQDVIDVDYDVPAAAGDAARAFRALLDELDAHSVAGTFLLPPPDPEITAYRRWFFDQFVVQLGGGQPTRWTIAADAGHEPLPG
jgi:hypothetical protein